jgi:hypothetical protein
VKKESLCTCILGNVIKSVINLLAKFQQKRGKNPYFLTLPVSSVNVFLVWFLLGLGFAAGQGSKNPPRDPKNQAKGGPAGGHKPGPGHGPPPASKVGFLALFSAFYNMYYICISNLHEVQIFKNNFLF